MRKSDIYGSGEWIKVDNGRLNLPGGPKSITLTIHENLDIKEWEDGKTQRVLAFDELGGSDGPRLGLNPTNWQMIAEITGEDDDENWPHHQIELYVTKTQFGGKLVDCVRIRPPSSTQAPVPAPADDGIPSGAISSKPLGKAAAAKLQEKLDAESRTVEDLRECIAAKGLGHPTGPIESWPHTLVDAIKEAIACGFDSAKLSESEIPF